MNYILFFIICLIFMALFHYVYSYIYESLKLYNTYEKNIECYDVNNNINDKILDDNIDITDDKDILKQHLCKKLNANNYNDENTINEKM